MSRDPRYKRSYMSATQFLHNHEMYRELAKYGAMKRNKDGSTSESVLADAGLDFTEMKVARDGLMLPVMVFSKAVAREEQRRTSAGLVYRVIVRCVCGDLIPLAKMGQHYGSKTCDRTVGGV